MSESYTPKERGRAPGEEISGALHPLFFGSLTFHCCQTPFYLKEGVFQIVRLVFQCVDFLLSGRLRGIRPIKGCVVGECMGLIAIKRSLPAGEPGRVKPVSAAPTASSTHSATSAESHSEASAPHRVCITRNRVSGTGTCGSSCHRSHSPRTCSISTWHDVYLLNVLFMHSLVYSKMSSAIAAS
jgi:hypothetical protein